MRSSSRLLISLCFAALPMAGFVNKPAMAEQVLGPAAAAAHLAKANAVAGRCGHLTAELRDELSGYAGMAEVVVAGQVGSDQVMRVMKQARKQAGGMTCGVETEDLALSAMEAAREAMNQTAGQTPAMRSTIAEVPVIEVEEEAAQVVNASIPDQAEIIVEPAIKPKPGRTRKKQAAGSLNPYVQATAAYYVERRCQHLGHASPQSGSGARLSPSMMRPCPAMTVSQLHQPRHGPSRLHVLPVRVVHARQGWSALVCR
jgi:hypothetical protein